MDMIQLLQCSKKRTHNSLLQGIFFFLIVPAIIFLRSPAEASTYCDLLYTPFKASQIKFPKPFLGIYLASKKVTKAPSPHRDAVYVLAAGIIKGSPVFKAGVQKDDVILSINGEPTSRDKGSVEESFRNTVEKLSIGSEVRLDILRNNKVLSIMAKTAERPQHTQPEAPHPEVPYCDSEASLLETSLLKESAMPSFQKVVNGLQVRSNELHNIDSPLEMPFHPLQLREMTYMLRNPLMAGLVAGETAHRLSNPFDKKDWSFKELLKETANLTDVEFPACVNPTVEYTLPALVKTLEEAAQQMRIIILNLTPEQQKMLREKVLDPWDDKRWNEILELSFKVDRKKVYGALSCLASFVSGDHLSALKEDLLKRFKNRDTAILYQADTSAGPVIVGGNKPKVYNWDAALILDLGGHNLYLNNAGGTRPDIPVAIVVDWGGHNRYVARDNFSQGAALFGGGFLFDLAGNSTFVALDGSQGAGFWGIGLLYHGGNSVFQARKNSQAVGQMGIGWLLSQEGHNSYSCLIEGQALGNYGGAGVMINKGGYNVYRLGGLEPDHRDPLKSTISMGQGFGQGLMPEEDKMAVPGGMGVLIDEKGSNTYIADYFAQGSSYYFSVGILDSRGANNRFIAGRYAQGAGIHSSVGVLLNRGGDSSFYSYYGVSQGMGHDYGVGFLQSDRGANEYWGGVLVQGAATRGALGVLLDRSEKSRFELNNDKLDLFDTKECMGLLIQTRDDLNRPGTVTVR